MSEQDGMQSTGRRRRWVRSAALVGSGFVAGGILVGAVTAAAAGDDRGPSTSREEALTGDTATQVEEAVLEEYPDAEIERLETDADGVYEAHIVTADGEELTVELDEEFAVTGTEERRGRGHGGRGGHGPGAGEEPLTGAAATQVEEAVLEEYPDAEIERLETDVDGVYEAHIVTADGEELTVELDEDFAITGTESRR